MDDLPLVASAFELQQFRATGLPVAVESEPIIACGFRSYAVGIPPAPPLAKDSQACLLSGHCRKILMLPRLLPWRVLAAKSGLPIEDKSLKRLVGAAGFEPTTPRPPV